LTNLFDSTVQQFNKKGRGMPRPYNLKPKTLKQREARET